MKTSYKILNVLFILLCIAFACNNINQKKLNIVLLNTSDIKLSDYPVYINIEDIIDKQPEIDLNENIIVSVNKKNVPIQKIEKGNKDVLMILLDFNPREQKELVLKNGIDKKNWIKRTHAELCHKMEGKFIDGEYVGGGAFICVDSLRVPNENTNNSFYIKYEGPGWESEKVGYRFYLDWRNAVDIFGNRTNDLILNNIGLDGYESYHDLNDWGMDILKVGNSLGLGSISTWTGKKAEKVTVTDSVICVVKVDGDLYSEINTKYYNWQSENGNIFVDSRLSITAGSRMTKNELIYDGAIDNLSTGIVKNDLPLIKGPADTRWGYMATWGKQSLNNDNLGMVIFFKNKDATEITEDKYSYIVVLDANNKNNIEYYFGAVWEKENNSNITENGFKEFLENTIVMLDNPVTINFK